MLRAASLFVLGVLGLRFDGDDASLVDVPEPEQLVDVSGGKLRLTIDLSEEEDDDVVLAKRVQPKRKAKSKSKPTKINSNKKGKKRKQTTSFERVLKVVCISGP